MKTARLVRRLDWEADAALYRLRDDETGVHGFVVVTTRRPHNGDHGSIVFAATATGLTSLDPIHRTEATDHADVLAELGYEVQP